MKNNKGFTLIEVLVAVTIMGIITAMALPEVQQLQAKNRDRKFESYASSLESSAKLYLDANEEDVFGYALSGCADISFKELKSKALAKDYLTNGISCDNDQSFVHIEKKEDKYTYKAYITCKKNGKTEYQTPDTVTKCDGSSLNYNSGSLKVNISVSDASKWTKQKTAEITISTDAEDGLLPGTFGSYCLSTSTSEADCIQSSISRVNFLNSTGAKTTKATVELANETGNLYFLFLAGQGRVADTAGNQIASSVPYSEKVKIDNTPPVITKIEERRSLFGTYVDVYFKEEPEGSEVINASYSLDGYVEKERAACQIVGLLGISCTYSEKASFLKSQLTEDAGDAGFIYFMLLDEAGNSSTYKHEL